MVIVLFEKGGGVFRIKKIKMDIEQVKQINV